MDCPECGSPLATYRLGGREAPVCEQCGHVGIEAEHRGTRARVESWSDALRRFYGSAANDDASLTVPVRSTDRDEEPARVRAETWSEALRRFYRADEEGGEGTDGSTDEPA
jgi:uncharacterized Zn finger protein (UPF0148 family)